MGADGPSPDNIVTAIGEVADRTTVIVREEIELAKAEVLGKVGKLGRGAGVAVAAGIFLSLAGIFFLHMLAWGFYVWLDVDVWVGYAIVVGDPARARRHRGLLGLPLAEGRQPAHAGHGDRGGPAGQGHRDRRAAGPGS